MPLSIGDVVSNHLRVMIVEEKRERAALLETALAAAGCEIAGSFIGLDDLQAKVNSVDPDVIVIAMESPDRDMLEDTFRMTREQPRPTVMFVDRSDKESIRAAVQAGVSAFVVGPLDTQRLPSILAVAVARFQEFQSLQRELESARSSLDERKVIERAKGILMKNRGLAEDDAFRMLRKMAMDRKVKLAAMAREIVTAAELLQ